MIRFGDVVGLDLSLTSTGIASRDGAYRIQSKARGMERLDEISNRILERVGTADLVIVEGYSFGSRSSQAHALGELGGVVRWRLWQSHVRFVDVPPSSLKKYATGRGNANKEEMLVSAVRRLGYEGSSNDEADALWLRAMGLDGIGAEPLVAMPAVNRVALDAVVWS